MRTEYHKLVRDNIPDYLQKKGITHGTRIAAVEERQSLLAAKLTEEVDEFVAAATSRMTGDIKEELIDVLDVLHTIGRYYHCHFPGYKQSTNDIIEDIERDTLITVLQTKSKELANTLEKSAGINVASQMDDVKHTIGEILATTTQLRESYSISQQQLSFSQMRKNARKGGFYDRVVLERTEE